jgi:hypothetical protein
MRTSVVLSTFPDEPVEFPDCSGMVDVDGNLVILEDTDAVETTYQPGEWVAFTTTAGDEA